MNAASTPIRPSPLIYGTIEGTCQLTFCRDALSCQNELLRCLSFWQVNCILTKCQFSRFSVTFWWFGMMSSKRQFSFFIFPWWRVDASRHNINFQHFDDLEYIVETSSFNNSLTSSCISSKRGNLYVPRFALPAFLSVNNAWQYWKLEMINIHRNWFCWADN